MITRYITNGTLYHEDGSIDRKVEVYCLSTDVKPTNVPNSTMCYEMDTKKAFMFDATSASWMEQ